MDVTNVFMGVSSDLATLGNLYLRIVSETIKDQ